MGIVRPTEGYERLSVYSLNGLLKVKGISVNVQIELNNFASADEILASGKLKTLRNEARSLLPMLIFKLEYVFIDLRKDTGTDYCKLVVFLCYSVFDWKEAASRVSFFIVFTF